LKRNSSLRLMRFAARLAYDGTAYHGFQRHKNAPTVQHALEDVLGSIAGYPVGVIGAGRTDAGVHATGQVIAFDLHWGHSTNDLRNALNAKLPADIAVREVWQCEDDFHPRFDARSRSYEYRLYVSDVRNPLADRFAWHLVKDVDIAAIEAAVRHLMGKQDFLAFGTPPQGENSVRTVFEAVWRQEPDGWHRFCITADAFLYRMVRTIVGTLVKVGQRQMTSDEFRGILAARQRGLAAALAPAHGLTLVAVTYSDET
jgi:tRNA pseudouridine38-40 synthase